MPPNKPKPKTYAHQAVWSGMHPKFPRWNIYVCRKCTREFTVHDQEAMKGFVPDKADCPVEYKPGDEVWS